MNAIQSSIVSLVESQALAYLVSSEHAAHPALVGDALVAAIEADAKSWLHGRISFLADLLWPSVEPTIHAAIAAQVALESGAATS